MRKLGYTVTSPPHNHNYNAPPSALSSRHTPNTSPNARAHQQNILSLEQPTNNTSKMVKDTLYDRIHFPSESEFLDPSPLTTPCSDTGEPLYTEIRIHLPRIVQPPSPTSRNSSTSTSRCRAHTLASSFSPFHRRSSSSSSAGKDLGEVEEKRMSTGSAMKDLVNRKKRSGTGVNALAVLPAVLVLSAELFTPGDDEKKNENGD